MILSSEQQAQKIASFILPDVAAYVALRKAEYEAFKKSSEAKESADNHSCADANDRGQE